MIRRDLQVFRTCALRFPVSGNTIRYALDSFPPSYANRRVSRLPGKPDQPAHLRAIADREASIGVQLPDFAAPVFELAHPTRAGHQRDKRSAAKNVTTALRNSSGFWI